MWGISKKQIKKHKSINKVQWEEYLKKNSNPKYIEHQDQMTKFVYGNRNADYNSLEEAIKGFNNGKGEPISIIGIKKKGAK